MGYKTLSLTLVSSKGFPGKTYVSISISGRTKKPTPIDRGGGSPTLVYTFDEAEVGNCLVVFKVMKRRVFGWDKVVGEVRVAVKKLLGGRKERRTATCEVWRKDKVVGELEIEYTAADAVVVVVQRRDDEDDDGYYDPRAADYDF